MTYVIHIDDITLQIKSIVMKDSYMYSVLGMKIWIDWSKSNSWIYFYLILNKNCKILLILGLRTGALVLGLRTSAYREKRSVQSMFILSILMTSYTILYVTPCSFCVISPPATPYPPTPITTTHYPPPPNVNL